MSTGHKHTNEFVRVDGTHVQFSAAGLQMLEQLAAMGMTVPAIAAEMGIPGKSAVPQRTINRNPLARAAFDRGRALAKMHKSPTFSLIRKTEAGEYELTAAGLKTITDVMARAGSDRSVAAALGISVKNYKRLLETNESARAASDMGFAVLESKVGANLLKMSKNQAIPAIFLAKSKCDFDDKAATRIAIDNSSNFTLCKLELNDSMTVEQYTKHMQRQQSQPVQHLSGATVKYPEIPTSSGALDFADQPPAWVTESEPEPLPSALSAAPAKQQLQRATTRSGETER